MSDKTKNGGGGSKGRPPASRGARPPSRSAGSGPRGPGSAPRGDKPFRKPEGERKGPPRAASGDKPFRSRDGERSGPARSGAGERPFRAREGGSGDKPFRPSGDKPFRAREGGGTDRNGSPGDRPFRARRDDARPSAPRRDEGGERAFRGRREDGARSFKSAAPTKKEFSERIAKVMARAGLCSRRDAEAWIEEGRVSVNGTVITSPALDVTKRDNIMVDGKLLPTRERTRLFLYHKPRGLVTTAKDPEGRTTVFERLPPGLPRVVTVGRLDINTEGLMLLTNDGGLSRVLELPETGWLRKYRVRAFGSINQAALDELAEGVTIDGMHYGPIEAALEREQGDNVWLMIGLREGKNREVKRILEHLGLQVNRLIRVSFGPFQLGDLAGRRCRGSAQPRACRPVGRGTGRAGQCRFRSACLRL